MIVVALYKANGGPDTKRSAVAAVGALVICQMVDTTLTTLARDSFSRVHSRLNPHR